MIVTKAGYQIRRSLTQWDYEIITLEVSQQLEQESPTDGTEMLSYCKELVTQFYSPVQAGQVPKVEHVPAQAPYQPNPGAQRAPQTGPRAYQPQGQRAPYGGANGAPRTPKAAAGMYAYKLPYPTNEEWKAICKQSGGGFDGIAKLWKSNVLLNGAEQYLVAGPSQQAQGISQEQQALGNDDIPF